MEEKRSCITINCGCCGNGNNEAKPTPGAGDGSPVGTVIAYMSTKVPEHYLACDGAEHRVEDYPLLSHHILDGFGMANYFGGDGTVTFAVPDLRNEFLRGYHGDAEAQLSGDVGKHQEATEHVNIGLDKYAQAYVPGDYKIPLEATKKDRVIKGTVSTGWTMLGSTATYPSSPAVKYTSRPTNTAVLYCIKYE